MSTKPLFDRWGRGNELYTRFTANAHELVDSDDEFDVALEAWTEFFVTSHGDIFDALPRSDPRTELFIDSLYFDFLIDQLIEYLEQTFDFTIENQEAHHNTDTLPFSFQSLHERIIDEDDVGDAIESTFSRDDLRAMDTTVVQELYESIHSRAIRLALGEYYTPRGVAELAIDSMTVDDIATTSFMDPGCGSGVFISVCIARVLDELEQTDTELTPDEIIELITSSVLGIDLNPVAVKSTKLNYLLALLPVLEDPTVDSIELPVFLTDALELTREDSITFNGQPFEPAPTHLVGNPPWITWNRLSEPVKDSWKDRYVDELDLLAHSGSDSRLGHANDDISIFFVWVCIHEYLREGGQASFVMKRDIMKGPAGKLLRQLDVAGRRLDVTHIHDFNTLQPFGDQVGANAAIYTFQTDRAPSFPLETTAWSTGDDRPDYSSREAMGDSLRKESTRVLPLDEDDSTSTWIREDAERAALGDCAHDIRHGVKDDAQDVFSIDRDQLDQLETEHVYPYLKSRHVVKYGLFGHELRLVPIEKANQDNEAELQNQYPQTYEYLEANRGTLEARSSSWLKQGTFYNIFGIGDYTWSDYKVVWCRLGFKPHFAVVSTVDDDDLGEKMVIPGDHYMFISTDSEQEAHYLCALLNSSIYQRSLKDIASEGKASLSKSIVSKLELPEWVATPETEQLAELSMRAHGIVPNHVDMSKRAFNNHTIDEVAEIQAEIDEIVEQLRSTGAMVSNPGSSTGSL